MFRGQKGQRGRRARREAERGAVHENGRRLGPGGQDRSTENQRRALDSVVLKFTFETLFTTAASVRMIWDGGYREAGMLREASEVALAATKREAPGRDMAQVVAETWRDRPWRPLPLELRPPGGEAGWGPEKGQPGQGSRQRELGAVPVPNAAAGAWHGDRQDGSMGPRGGYGTA